MLSISAERWEEAQRYEATCWLERYRTATDDREREHAARFDGYRALAGNTYAHAIELGCGPFTQIRRILRGGVDAEELTLVDPLLDRYEELPNCSYLRLARGRRLIRYASTLEDLRVPARGYDLVVSINVLEHCRDSEACLDTLRTLARKGGTIVISEPGIARADLDEVLAKTKDAGHPIRVADDRLHRDIESLGRPIYGRMFPGLYGASWRRDYYYILEAQ